MSEAFTEKLLGYLTADIAVADAAGYLTSYVGRHFEFIGGGGDKATANIVTAEDIVAVEMLSVTIPAAVSADLLLGQLGEDVSRLLTRILPDIAIADDAAESLLSDGGPADLLYKSLREHQGMGRTITSKLLARKRPHLIPIRDEIVWEALGRPERFWDPMRAAFRQPPVKAAIEKLRTDAGVSSTYSDLRIADIVVWRAAQRGLANQL